MTIDHSNADAGVGGDASAAGHRADPVATNGKATAQAGGPHEGDPETFGSGIGKGAARPSGDRADASPATVSNAVAPLVHTAMDDVVRDVEARAAALSRA